MTMLADVQPIQSRRALWFAAAWTGLAFLFYGLQLLANVADDKFNKPGEEPFWTVAPLMLLFLWLYLSPIVTAIALVRLLFDSERRAFKRPRAPQTVAAVVLYAVLFTATSVVATLVNASQI